MTTSADTQPQVQKLHFTALQALFTKHFGESYNGYEQLTAHGSDRVIIRLKSKGHQCIGIVNPHKEENKAFISFARTFRANGINVPEIYSDAKDESSYLLEDLGDETLLDRIKSTPGGFTPDITGLYENVIEQLTRFQVDMAGHIDFGLCYQFNVFGKENIDYDINYFKERFLKIFYKGKIDETLLDSDFNYLKAKILDMPADFFLYRDFQSRNIMLKNKELYFIDFQSGRHGALLYDLASLLYDAKADIPQSIREQLLEYYLTAVSKHVSINAEKYRQYFWYFAVIRILQAMGAYGYVGIVKGRSKFLESIPYALKNINFILNSRLSPNELGYLKAVFSELLTENTNKENTNKENTNKEEKLQ